MPRPPLALATLLLAGCPAKAREADPAPVRALATTMLAASPIPGVAPMCTPNQLLGGATMTGRTLRTIAGRPIDPKDHKLDPWVNPGELDVPAATVLADPAADVTAQRQAAAELMAAPFFLVYRIDAVDAPMALGIKEPKRGAISATAIHYDKVGAVKCVHLFQWENNLDTTQWAIAKSNKTLMDPDVVKVLQDDLRARMLVHVASLAAPAVLPGKATSTRAVESELPTAPQP